MLREYPNADFVNTSEAYSSQLFIGNNHNIVIPYVAIDLMPSNPIMAKRTIIDYSYYVCIGVMSICFYGKEGDLFYDLNISTDKTRITEYIMLGGYKNDKSFEVEIKCEKTILCVPDYAKMGSYPCPFVPVDTPNFPRNMPIEEVDSFFDLLNLPQELKQVLGQDIHSVQPVVRSLPGNGLN